MPLSTYFLEYGHHVGPLRPRRLAHAPTSNTANHDNHVKINSWVSFDEPRGVWKCGQTLSCVFVIFPQSKLKQRRKGGLEVYASSKHRQDHGLCLKWMN